MYTNWAAHIYKIVLSCLKDQKGKNCKQNFFYLLNLFFILWPNIAILLWKQVRLVKQKWKSVLCGSEIITL